MFSWLCAKGMGGDAGVWQHCISQLKKRSNRKQQTVAYVIDTATDKLMFVMESCVRQIQDLNFSLR